ncbi:hypothetical protein [Streptomyces sp. NPDC048419]|uniref:hypothetical protein n=1 Tax=Streptomyces sp. NPDC048419 TaxID=3365547 RepID=UPI00371B7F01
MFLVPLSVVALWTHQINDTDRYVAVMGPLARNPDIQNAVADRATEEIQRRSPAGSFSAEEADALSRAAHAFTHSQAFPAAWDAAVRAYAAKETFMGPDDTNALTVDLGPVIDGVKKQATSAGVQAADRIPQTKAPVSVLDMNTLETLRRILRALSAVGVWLPIGTLLLTAAAIILSTERIRSLMTLGLSYAIGASLLWGSVAVIRQLTLNDLDPNANRQAVEALYNALTNFLQTASYVLAAVGLLVSALCWGALFRKHRRATGAPRQATA